MRTPPRATRTAFRRAVWASVAIHVAAAGALVVLIRSAENTPPPRETAIDTRVPHVRMHLTEDIVDVEVRSEPPAPAPAPPDPPQPPPAPPQPIEVPPASAGPPLHTGPVASHPPRTLPPELVALIRRPAAPSAPGPTHDPNVKPAGAVGTPPVGGAGAAMHGALKPGQTVVYVLDSSGSMGAAGKFAAARAALAATLARQPEAVRFQVVVYDSTARPLLASGGAALPATAANVLAATKQLAAVEPRGRSSHLVALRAALDFRPDVVVWLTDADDLSAAALKPVLKSAGRPVPVCVGLVTAGGVQQPRELK